MRRIFQWDASLSGGGLLSSPVQRLCALANPRRHRVAGGPSRRARCGNRAGKTRCALPRIPSSRVAPLSNQLRPMKLQLSCTDFSFPLLSHDAALKVIALLGWQGVDVGLFSGRSRLRPEAELRKPAKSGAILARRLAQHGLVVADVFLQLH